MDLWGWVDDQRDLNRQRFQQLLEEGSRKWQPNDIFRQCCVKWLVDGPVRDDPYGLYDEYSPRNGCSGGCGRAHPIITLYFDDISNSTTATLSHALNPFVCYFQGLVSEGKAQKLSMKVYQMSGFLRPVVTALRVHKMNHFLKIAEGSMESSDNAQAAELEKEDRASKRARKNNDCDTKSASTIPSDILEKAMGVVLNHRYLEHDHVCLFTLRPVCKLFKNIAMAAAQERIKTVDLSITPLVNGTSHYGDSWMDGYDTETCKHDYDPYGDPSSIEYTKRDKVKYAFQEEPVGGHYPVNAEAATFSWDSGELLRDLDHDEDDGHDQRDWAEYAYNGNLLRVYWHPKDADDVNITERTPSIYGGVKPSLGLLVAEFYISGHQKQGVATKSQRGISVEYEVLESNAIKTEEVDEEDGEESEDSSRGGTSNRRRYIKYTGTVKLMKVKADYGNLVRAQARKIKSKLNTEIRNALKERPLRPSEEEYFNLMGNAAS